MIVAVHTPTTVSLVRPRPGQLAPLGEMHDLLQAEGFNTRLLLPHLYVKLPSGDEVRIGLDDGVIRSKVILHREGGTEEVELPEYALDLHSEGFIALEIVLDAGLYA